MYQRSPSTVGCSKAPARRALATAAFAARNPIQYSTTYVVQDQALVDERRPVGPPHQRVFASRFGVRPAPHVVERNLAAGTQLCGREDGEQVHAITREPTGQPVLAGHLRGTGRNGDGPRKHRKSRRDQPNARQPGASDPVLLHLAAFTSGVDCAGRVKTSPVSASTPTRTSRTVAFDCSRWTVRYEIYPTMVARSSPSRR